MQRAALLRGNPSAVRPTRQARGMTGEQLAKIVIPGRRFGIEQQRFSIHTKLGAQNWPNPGIFRRRYKFNGSMKVSRVGQSDRRQPASLCERDERGR